MFGRSVLRNHSWLILTVLLCTFVVGPYRGGGAQETGNVPSVIGLSAQEAKAAIEAAGLKVQFLLGDPAPSQDKALTAYSQDPKGGTSQAKQSLVKVTIYNKPAAGPAVAAPSLLGMSAAEAIKKLQAAGLTGEVRVGRPAARRDLVWRIYAQDPPPPRCCTDGHCGQGDGF